MSEWESKTEKRESRPIGAGFVHCYKAMFPNSLNCARRSTYDQVTVPSCADPDVWLGAVAPVVPASMQRYTLLPANTILPTANAVYGVHAIFAAVPEEMHTQPI